MGFQLTTYQIKVLHFAILSPNKINLWKHRSKNRNQNLKHLAISQAITHYDFWIYSFPDLVEFDVLYWYIQDLLGFIRSLFPNHLHKLSNLHGNMMPKYTLLS